MERFRQCVSVQHSRLQDTPKAFSRLDDELRDIFGPIHHNPKLFDSLYVPVSIREYTSDFASVGLWKRPPTLSNDVQISREFGSLAKDIGRWARQRRHTVAYILSPIGTGKSTYLTQLVRDIHKSFPDILVARSDVEGLEEAQRFLPRLYETVAQTVDDLFPEFFRATNDHDLLTIRYPSLRSAFTRDLLRAGILVERTDERTQDRQMEWLEQHQKADPLKFARRQIDWANEQLASRRSIVLAIDNLDQHLAYFGDELLIRCHGAGETLSCVLLLTLRDTSYRANNSAFAQASYHRSYFNLVPAPARSVVRKRLGFLKGQPIGDKPLDSFVRVLTAKFGAAGDEDEAVRTRIVDLLQDWGEKLANGDRRQLLQVLRTIISSPHITSDSFKRSYIRTNDYSIAQGNNTLYVKVKMAMMLGRYNYYNDDAKETVFVLNLFDTGKVSARWHSLLRLKMLQHLALRREAGVRSREMIERCTHQLGAEARSVVIESIGKFVEVGLAAMIDEGDSFENTLVSHPVAHNIQKYLDRTLHITHNGDLHLKTLLRDSIYLDEMRLTSSMPEAVAQDVCWPFRPNHEPHASERLDSTKQFLQYLVECEEDDVVQRLSSELSVPKIMPDVLEHYRTLERRLFEFYRVKSSRSHK